MRISRGTVGGKAGDPRARPGGGGGFEGEGKNDSGGGFEAFGSVSGVFLGTGILSERWEA